MNFGSFAREQMGLMAGFSKGHAVRGALNGGQIGANRDHGSIAGVEGLIPPLRAASLASTARRVLDPDAAGGRKPSFCMKITREEVLHVARLAQLDLTDDEVALFTRQLDAILAYVEQLRTVSTEGVEPTAHVIPVSTPLRSDEVHASLPAESVLNNAPARSGSYFAVPKVLEGG